MPNIVKSNWYQNLVEDCKDIITETIFTSRWTLIEGYHQLGKRIRQDSEKMPITELVQDLAVTFNKQNMKMFSERTLWYAVQFYDTYPDINKLPEGKNISWNKIITKYLPKAKSEEVESESIADEDKQEAKITCPRCGFSWNKGAKII